jgi:hypothetical protein
MLSVIPGSSFDLELARELLLLVEQAHKEFDRAKKDPDWDWDQDRSSFEINGREYLVVVRFGFAEYFYTPSSVLSLQVRDRVPFGFIAQNIDKTKTYIVFRGTMTPAEWVANFTFKPDSRSFLEDDQLGKVHRGFYRIYTREDEGRNPLQDNDNTPGIKECIEHAIRGCKKHSLHDWPGFDIDPLPIDSQLFFAGHSLGGALATLSARHVEAMDYFRADQPLSLYTFASPRVGDPVFAQSFQRTETFRVANSEDLVPNIPLASVDLIDKDAVDTSSAALTKAVPSGVKQLLPDLDFSHVGEPISFSLHRGSIAENHIIPIYKTALGIAGDPG